MRSKKREEHPPPKQPPCLWLGEQKSREFQTIHADSRCRFATRRRDQSSNAGGVSDADFVSPCVPISRRQKVTVAAKTLAHVILESQLRQALRAIAPQGQRRRQAQRAWPGFPHSFHRKSMPCFS